MHTVRVLLLGLALGLAVGSRLAAEGPRQELEKQVKALSERAEKAYFAGKFVEAADLQRQAVDVLRRLYPRGHADLAAGLTQLGLFLAVRSELTAAEATLRDALALYRKLDPKDKPSEGLAANLNHLGWVLQRRGQFEAAESFFRDALAMNRQLHPKGHAALANNLTTLGYFLQERGGLFEAEQLLREAVAMNRRLHPQGSADLAASLTTLGLLLQERGELTAAEPFFREALALNRKLYPPEDHPQGHAELATGLNNLGLVLHYKGELTAAEPYYRDAVAMYQKVFAKGDFPQGQYQLAAALNNLASRDPRTRDLGGRLHDTRLKLARLLLSPAQDPKRHERLTRELTEKKEDLEKRIAQLLRTTNAAAERDAGTPRRLAERLPDGVAFIDLLRYVDFVYGPPQAGKLNEQRTPRYVGFVVQPGRPVQRVELGPAAAIDRAIERWRNEITDPSQPAGEARDFLGRTVWKPLARVLPADTRLVYLSPDGELTRVPWAALPGRTPDRVLLEEHALALVPHGPFLLRELTGEREMHKQGRLLVVGGVDYQKAPVAVAAVRGDIAHAPLSDAKRPVWRALPGTVREQQLVLDQAAKVFADKPIARRGADATTGQLLADLPAARFAHLATHGFFADPRFRSAFQVDERLFAFPGTDRGTVGARSPLVLSGLVFAGANDPKTPDRGIVTAEGIVGLRLEDLELAVLSACETGLGEVAGGEGVFGLQRAFHIAGGRQVIASLWKVDDEATAALMALFYHHLWEKKRDALTALREAQLYVYRHPEQLPQLAQGRNFELVPAKPVPGAKRTPAGQWAAFVLSGVGR